MTTQQERMWTVAILGFVMIAIALIIGINTMNAQKEADQREDQIILMCADMIVEEHGIDLADALSFCQAEGQK